jgi:hypothetical protein
MAINKDKSNIDVVVSYLLIKKLSTPIVRTEAYKLKLVNVAGKVIKEPSTDKERSALTLLDRLVFKLKRLLGTKIVNLNQFLYLQTLQNDFYNKLIIRGSVEQRAEIKRINNDVKKINEKYDKTIEDLLVLLIHEQLEDEDGLCL